VGLFHTQKIAIKYKKPLVIVLAPVAIAAGTSGVACRRSVAVAGAAGTVHSKKFLGLVAKRAVNQLKPITAKASIAVLLTTWTNPPKAC